MWWPDLAVIEAAIWWDAVWLLVVSKAPIALALWLFWKALKTDADRKRTARAREEAAIRGSEPVA